MNKVLVIGSGGREHALAWRLSLSTSVSKTLVAPGNAGTALDQNIENISLDCSNFEKVAKFCKIQSIDLVVVGPEQPLVAGIVDYLTEAGINCFGPSAKAAQLEGSKAFAKAFLEKHHIPTANYGEFTDTKSAKEYLQKQSFPIVIKADGLAAGKGVIIAQDLQQAENTVDDMLTANAFGDAGNRIIIEEFLYGEEASYIVMTDGKSFLPMATSQDHKARDNGDLGPNTGGMGAYSPAPIVSSEINKKIIETVIKPTLDGMTKDGMSFTGFLYAGLMIDEKGGIKVLEFNVRFGDPETQPIMMRLESNLDQLCLSAIKGQLDQQNIKWDKRFALGVVMAENGYPESYQTGNQINGLGKTEKDIKIFHAGTRLENDKVLTNGGRVLCVCATNNDLKTAQSKAYQAVNQIKWNSQYYRTDIGHKAIK